jgi:trans-aconitate 2-methyltransferase
MATAPDWNAAQYLRFEDERTRPSIDLLARVPLTDPERCIDLGCGPGNSTELVAARFPQAQVEGLDSSPDMLDKARKRLPQLAFTLGDVGSWLVEGAYDLIFANAVLQWLPDHAGLFPQLVRSLKRGGCLAVQMPDNLDRASHVAMREVATEQPWAGKLAPALAARSKIGSFGNYRRWLTAAGCKVDLWQTTYVHELDGLGAIADWFKSTGLKPFLDRLDAEEQEAYLQRYLARIAPSYPVENDGKVLLPFPRLFIVAIKG